MINDIQAINAFKDNYIWLLIDNKQGQAVCVDPGDATPVLQALTKQHLDLVAVIITHHHWDHTNGIEQLLTHYNIPVYGPSHGTTPEVSMQLQDGDHITLLGNDFHILAIPGHTLDHIAYYGDGRLFCGDTLFSAGCGRTFEGTASQMYQSLQKLAALPEDTLIYCAHEYTQNNLLFAKMIEPNNQAISERQHQANKQRQQGLPTLPVTLAVEKQTNPFLRCKNKDVIDSASQYRQQSLADPVAVFAALRAWKDNF